jgi:quercetin dioxygenase-like cupin family protein
VIHTPVEEHAWTDVPDEYFTGVVKRARMAEEDEAGTKVSGVHFEPGARTNWHSHPHGQILYVVGGEGLVQNADGHTVEIAAGDVVYSPPGELHWHGARSDEPMMHLSILTPGDTTWDQPVTDEEYTRRG